MFSVHMRSKSSYGEICNFSLNFDHFMNKNGRTEFQKMKMFIFYQRSKIVDRSEISAICDLVLTSFCVKESQKWLNFRVWVPYTPNMSAPATPLNSATLWGSCCLKTTLVVFVAKNCWFYQNLKTIGSTNEKWMFQGAGGRNFDRNFCQKAPHQYVANL